MNGVLLDAAARTACASAGQELMLDADARLRLDVGVVYVVDGALRVPYGAERLYGPGTLIGLESLISRMGPSLVAAVPSRVRVFQPNEWWRFCEAHLMVLPALGTVLVRELDDVGRHLDSVERQANLGTYLGMVAHDGVASLNMSTGNFDVALLELHDAALAMVPLLGLSPEGTTVVERCLARLDDVESDTLVLAGPAERDELIAIAGQHAHDWLAHLECAAQRIIAARSSVRTGVAMMQSILDMIRPDHGVPTDVNDTIRRVMMLLQQSLRSEGVRVTLDLRAIGTIIATPGALMRVWLNLCRNAIDAMGRSPELRIASSDEPAGVRVIVRDNGPGIPKEMMATLFTPFRSTKRDGLGLGLHSVNLAVQALGGSVACTSQPGETVFTIHLPRTHGTDD